MRGDWNHVEPDFTQERPEDNTSQFINEQIQEWKATGTVIHPESAMEIAAWYHSPAAKDSGITAFSHSGTITNTLISELVRDRNAEPRSENEKEEIDALLAYVREVTGSGEQRAEELIQVDWYPRTRQYVVKARASAENGWNYYEGNEDEIDELLGIARDVMTGG